MENVDKILSYLFYVHRSAVRLLRVKNLNYPRLLHKSFTDKGYLSDPKAENAIKEAARNLKIVFTNYHNRHLATDKYSCYLWLRNFSTHTLPVYALIDHGEVYLVDKYKTILELFTKEKQFVLKPRTGRWGEGVMVLNTDDGSPYHREKYPKFPGLIKQLKNYILVPYVQQHEYSSRIFAESLNTIRLITGIIDQEVVLLLAGHWFGSELTKEDNRFSEAGVTAIIDINTGKLQNAVAWSKKKRERHRVDRHPFTGEQINGIKIPGWREVIRSMLALHASMKYIKYVGWDIAITPGSYKIIEADYATDLDGQHMYLPLLLEDFNRRFFSAI